MFDKVSVESPMLTYHGRRSGNPDAGVSIVESAVQGMIIIRGSQANDELGAGVRDIVGCELPVTACTYTTYKQSSIYWLGPTEWLLVSTTENCQRYLIELLECSAVVVDVHGGFTSIRLSGAFAEAVLKKSCHYDFAKLTVEPSRCVQTNLAKASALISRVGENEFVLLIRRSFADYVATWLLDAASEYGCEFSCEGGLQ